MRVKVIPPDNVRMIDPYDGWRYFRSFFEVRLENIVVLALQQALERLHYRDFSCGRHKETETHQLGVIPPPENSVFSLLT